jgi:photosystem II stability/assembly factor-like uncharacterized protein
VSAARYRLSIRPAWLSLGLVLLLIGLALALPTRALAAGGWYAQTSGVPADTYLNGVAFVNANDGWAVGYSWDTGASAILATTDGGATWSAQGSGAIADTWLDAVAFANASDGWAVGWNGNTYGSTILATTNGGATWSAQSSGVVADTQLHSVAFANVSDGWAVGDDTSTGASVILATRNGGATWSAQSSGVVADTGLNAVACASARDAWAVGYGPGTVLATTDAGYPAPTLTGFDPASGVAGSSVTVCGTGFTGATAVGFNGTAASFTVVDDTQIAATVPAKATSGPIGVTAPGGSVTSAASFTVIRPPTITSFSPTWGKRGTPVTVAGTSFGAKRGTSCVKFGATKCHKYLSWSNTRIRCRVPAEARLGTLKLTVKTAAGASNAKHFKVKR